MAVEERAPAKRSSDELKAYMDQLWRQLRATEDSRVAKPRTRASWVLRHLLTIGLAHVAVLLTTYFLLLVGDALFTSYALVMHDAVFVSYVAQLGWLQRMASDIKAAIAFVVGLSALLQMLLFLWRVSFD